MTLKSMKVRIFLSCWMIFVLHFATDFVREHYLVLSIAEDYSFRLDKYIGLHQDIFMTPHHGAHHGANPGASIIAAIPYFIFKPAINWTVNRFSVAIPKNENKGIDGAYQDYRPARVKFYKKVRERGLDIKFGLLGFVTMAFCMAPLSAFSAVIMFQALCHAGLTRQPSLLMAFLYALGTPIFFRTAYLNQNLMVGIFAFIGFILLWQTELNSKTKFRKNCVVAGFLGGLALLCDYSGLVPLVMLYFYGLIRLRSSLAMRHAFKESSYYFYGAIGPIILLWTYQYLCFGHLFYPPQFSMPPQIYSEVGYQGIRWPSIDLIRMLLFDFRFGLFVVSPILFLGLFTPILNVVKKSIIPSRETIFILIFFVASVLFFSFIEYTRLQWVTGIRYIVPVIPFLFLLTANILVRMPRYAVYVISFLAIGQSWAMSMARRGVGVPEESMLMSLKSIFFEGLQLPWLNTLSKMKIKYLPFVQQKWMALPFILITAFLVYFIWRYKTPLERSNYLKTSKTDSKEASS